MGCWSCTPAQDRNSVYRRYRARQLRTSHLVPCFTRRFAINVIDQHNRDIISILQRDGRRSFTAIARQVGISEAAVRARVQKLTDDGLIRVVAVTDPLRLGFDVMALVGVQANSDLSRVADEVSGWEETSYVVLAAGSYDLLVEVVCEDNAHLLRVVERLRGVEGVKSTETFMYLALHKMSYAWGTGGG
jgi:Lrp/AsnC family transcriptional regulator, regulator for asnA, asnC and gidA